MKLSPEHYFLSPSAISGSDGDVEESLLASGSPKAEVSKLKGRRSRSGVDQPRGNPRTWGFILLTGFNIALFVGTLIRFSSRAQSSQLNPDLRRISSYSMEYPHAEVKTG